jgi:protease IV
MLSLHFLQYSIYFWKGLIMDLNSNNNSPDVTSSTQNVPPVSKPKTRNSWKIFWGIVIGFVLLTSVAMFLVLIGVIALFSTGSDSVFNERIIQAGLRTNKIAVINLEGIIDSKKAYDIYEQLKTAKEDSKVKGVILRVSSPGGTVSASDQINNEIRKYRKETGKPIVAFMQGIAASGGYYTSVACNEIMAEPTTITGSVGVIMGYLVLQRLLEEKLGIQPVIIKSGLKKDWPSSFTPPTEEQLQYLQDKLIRPAYERFVQIVADGRESLDINDVRRLADGSIYTAQEALEEKLIDKIGYLDEAIARISQLADITKPNVVEYRKQFSLTEFLGSNSRVMFKIDRSTLYELNTPDIMYLWSAP